MKKITLLLIIITSFTSVSYASFPITDTLEVKQDTLQTEEIKKYHDHLIKMGFDLNTCKCESCRNGIDPLTNNLEKNSNLKKNIWIQLLIIITILSIVLVILLFRWAENFDKSGGIGG
jgi:hypothetical protein